MNSNLMQSLSPVDTSKKAWNPPGIRSPPSKKASSSQDASNIDKHTAPKTPMATPGSFMRADWKRDKGTLPPAHAAKGTMLGVPYESRGRSPSPPQPPPKPESPPPLSPTELRHCLVTWTGDELETMVRDKIQMKTHGGNGQMLMALRLFESAAAGEITPEMFQSALTRLLNV